MKKALGTVVALALAAAVVHGATEVKSVNTVGFTKVGVNPGAFSLIGLNFESLDAQGQTLRGVLNSGLVANDFPFLADQVYVFDTGTSVYNAYYQRTDGLFYDVGAFVSPSDYGLSTNPVVSVGQGLFVSGSTIEGAHDVALMGEVVSKTNAVVPIVTSFQMVAFPFSQAIDLQQTSFATMPGVTANDFPFLADNIYLLTPSGSYVSYYIAADGQWRDVSAWAPGNPPAPATGVTVALGQGFFYEAKNPSLWSWAETNRYLTAIQ